MKNKIISLLLMFLTAMIWGFAFVAQVEGASSLAPFSFNGVRFLIGTIALLPVVLFFERGKTDNAERRRTFIASLATGVILFTASTLQQYGIAMTASAGISGFITGLYTVLVPIVCFLLFRQKIGWNVWLGAILATAGLFLICYRVGEGLHFGLGELILLIGAFFWTAHVILVDKLGQNLRSLHFAWGQFAVCAVLGLLGMFLLEEPTVNSILEAKIPLLYCGILSTGVAYTLQVIAQKRVAPAFAAIVLSTESVFSAVGGVLFGIDVMTWIGLLGCVLIFGGIVFAQLTMKKKNKA